MSRDTFTLDDKLLETIANAIKLDAEPRLCDVEDSSWDGVPGEALCLAEPSIDGNEYYIEYRLMVWMTYNSDSDVYECGLPHYEPRAYEIEVTDVDVFIGEDCVEVDDAVRAKMFDGLNEIFGNRQFKAA